jgi:hypothetical protein
VKFFLDQPCSDLSRELLLDEHQSVHAFFGGMLKTPSRWGKHSILGPMDPKVLALRHVEQVKEMEMRGYNHQTPLRSEDIEKVHDWRNKKDLLLGERFNNKGKVVQDEELAILQRDYVRRMHNELCATVV